MCHWFLPIPRYLFLFLLLWSSSFAYAQSQSPNIQDTLEEPTRYFEGVYIGVNLGIQSVFSGIPVNDVIISQQQSRWVGELFIAHRWQFLDDRVVFGLEVQTGITDGKFEQIPDNAQGFIIHFRNNSQVGLGYNVGFVSGSKRNLLLNAYIYQIRRTFDITSTNGTRTLELSSDSQTALRYGIGAEYHFTHKLNVRITLGSLTDDNQGNFPIRHRLETMAGLIFQF